MNIIIELKILLNRCLCCCKFPYLAFKFPVIVIGNMHVTSRSQIKNVGTANVSNTEEDIFVT